MGRWTQYDEDDYRLPEGMKRLGYDADSGRYYFGDRARGVWQGPVGAEFGEMTRVNTLPTSLQSGSSPDERQEHDVEASPRGTHTRPGGYQLLTDDSSRTMAHNSKINTGAYRTLFPFFLIIAVFLLLVWRLIVSPGLSVPTKKCPEGTSSYWIQPGDSCWEVSHKHGWTLDKFKEANPKTVCDPLTPGTSVCLPPDPKSNARIMQAKATGSQSGAKATTRRS